MHSTMRHMIAGAGGIIALALLGTFLIIYGRNAGGQVLPPANQNSDVAATTTAQFTVLSEGTASSIKKRVNYLISSEADFKKLWDMLGTEKALPNIDFTSTDVIAAFAGGKGTGGHSIVINKIEDSVKRAVFIEIRGPGEKCIVSQALTYPYQVVSVDKSDLEITHEDILVNADCE